MPKKIETNIRICIICERDIGDSPKRMIPIEKPYLNLWIHTDCYVNYPDDFNEYLKKYIETNTKSRKMV